MREGYKVKKCQLVGLFPATPAQELAQMIKDIFDKEVVWILETGKQPVNIPNKIVFIRLGQIQQLAKWQKAETIALLINYTVVQLNWCLCLY